MHCNERKNCVDTFVETIVEKCKCKRTAVDTFLETTGPSDLKWYSYFRFFFWVWVQQLTKLLWQKNRLFAVDTFLETTIPPGILKWF